MLKEMFYKLQERVGYRGRHLKSKMTILYAVLVAVSLVQLVTSNNLYDCNNLGEDTCLNSGKCHYFGFCQCLTGFIGYNCGIHKSRITKGASCKIKCHNNGICYDGHKCQCTYGFVGEHCEYPRTGVICKKGLMELVAYRNMAFKGEINIWNEGFGCLLVPNKKSEVPGMHRYARDIKLHPLSPDCTPKKSVDPVTGDVTFSVDIVSTSHRKQFGSRDKVTTHKCVYKAMRHGVTTDITDSKYLANLSVVDPTTGEPLQVHEENKLILLEFAPAMAGMKGVMVDYLEIYSINRNMDVQSKVIIEQGCVNTALQASIGPLKNYSELKDGLFVGKVQFKSFIIFPNEPLLFNYRLTYCPNQCAQPTCPPPTPPTP